MGSANTPHGSEEHLAAPKSREDVVALLADVEGQLKALKQAHESRRRESARLREIQDSIAKKEREVESRAAALKDQHQELDEARQRLAEMGREASTREREHGVARARVGDLERELEDARSKFQRLGEELAGARADLHSAHELAAQRQKDREAREESWRVEGQSLRDQIDVLRKERENLKQESKSLRKNSEGARQDAKNRIQDLERRILALESEIQSRDDALTDLQGEFQQARDSNADLQCTISQLQTRLGEGEAAAGEQIDQLKLALDDAREALVTANCEWSEQGETLREEVGEARALLEQARSESRESIESLRAQLEQAQHQQEGMASEAIELVESERRALGDEIDTLQSNLAKATDELETRTQELRTVAGEYQEVCRGLAEAKAGAEETRKEIAESRGQIDRQRSQCDTLEEALAQAVAREKGAQARAIDFERRMDAALGEGDIDQEMAERIKELVDQRDRAQCDIENLAKENQRLRVESEQGSPEAESLRAELDDARRKLEQALEGSPSGIGPGVVTTARCDGWIETRRGRLRVARRLLKDRARKFKTAGGALSRRMEETEALIKQRGEVVQATHRLRAMEKRLNQRQAGAKAGIGVICMVLSLAIVGFFAWITAGSIAPARFAAVISIEPHVSGRALTEEQMRVWKESTQEILLDPGVIDSAATRMANRGIEDLSEPGSLMLRLEQDLAVLDTGPDRITLELRGDGKREIERALDTYSRAVVSAANLRGSILSSGAAAQLAGSVEVGEPIESQHLYYAVVGVAIGALLCVLLMLVLYRKLAKVKSDFEQAAGLDLVLDDARWIGPSPIN